ncbi:MAG TPA: hypothetical protein VGE74_01115 [Gemmata sp.]
MAVIEVTCPNPSCGARLKAPSERIGKKAKCNKCQHGFQIPGPVPVAGSAEEPVPSAATLPAPELTEPAIPMASAVTDEELDTGEPLPIEKLPPPKATAPEELPSPKAPAPPAPAKNLADPPSEDPFDFSQPAAPAAKSAAPAASRAAKPAAPVAPKAAHSNPAAKPAPPAAKPAEIPTGDGADEQPKSKPKSKSRTVTEPDPEPEPTPADDAFSFGFTNEPEPAKPKSTRRPGDGEEGRRARKKTRDEGADERPRKKSPAAGGDAREADKNKVRDDEPEDELESKPRYRRPGEKGGMGKAIALSAAVALIATALAIAAGVVYMRNNRPPEVKKEEKKEEPSAAIPPDVPTPVAPKDKEPDPKPKDKEPAPKPTDTKPKDKEPGPPPTRPAVVLDGKFRAIAVSKEPTKVEPADRASEQPYIVEAPFASVVRVFPPFDPKTSDAHLVTRVGARFALDAFSPSSGKRVSRLEFAADPQPLCDLTATATDGQFLAVSAGRVTVWALAGQKKLADAVDPYADKPDHARDGLAAVFFANAPGQIVTVSTAGAVHLFDLTTKAVVSEFVPPHGAKGAVAAGGAVSRAGDGSIVLAVGGIVYQIKSAPNLERVRAYDLGGDVKPLAIGSAGAPGRLVFAFETEVKGKKGKERVLLYLPIGAPRPTFFLLPAAAGTPTGAFWANDTDAGVVTERGVVWFDEDEDKFGPVVMTKPVSGGLYAGARTRFWYVVPRSSNAAQSVLVPLTVPFGDAAEFRGTDANKPLRVVRIDQNGLSK